MDRSKSHNSGNDDASPIELEEWQIEGIKLALKAADEGKFATDREVQSILRKWRKLARRMP